MTSWFVLPTGDTQERTLENGGKEITLPAMEELVQAVLKERERLKATGNCPEPKASVADSSGVSWLVKQAIVGQLGSKQASATASYTSGEVLGAVMGKKAWDLMNPTPAARLAANALGDASEVRVLLVRNVAEGIELMKALRQQASEASFAGGYAHWLDA